MSSTTAGRDTLEGRVWFWWDGRVLLSTLVFKCYQHARVQSVLSFCALGCTRFHNLSHPRPLRAFFLTTPGVTARGWSGVLRRDFQKLISHAMMPCPPETTAKSWLSSLRRKFSYYTKFGWRADGSMFTIQGIRMTLCTELMNNKEVL